MKVFKLLSVTIRESVRSVTCNDIIGGLEFVSLCNDFKYSPKSSGLNKPWAFDSEIAASFLGTLSLQ